MNLHGSYQTFDFRPISPRVTQYGPFSVLGSQFNLSYLEKQLNALRGTKKLLNVGEKKTLFQLYRKQSKL